MSLQDLTVKGLRDIARENGISGYSNLRKAELINLLEDSLGEKKIASEVRKSPKKLKKYKGKGKEKGKEKEEDNGKEGKGKGKEKEEENGDCISRSLVELKPHQIAVAKYFENHRGLIAAFDVGSGKTLAAIAASQCVLDAARREGKKMNIVVITPKTLRENFRKEMVKYGLEYDDPNYTIYTPTQYYYASKRGETTDVCKNNFLIVDEAHHMKKMVTPKTLKRYMKFRVPDTIAMSVIDCAIKADKVLLLTATPAPNRVHDILNLVAMVKGELPLKPDDLSKLMANESAFKRYFRCLFAFYKPIRSGDYPKIIQVNKGKIEIEMSPKYYKEYMKLERMQGTQTNPWTFYVGLRQGSNTIKECIKCSYVMRVIEERQKTLIYSAFRSKGVGTLTDKLESDGISFLKITGETPEKDRKNIVEEFNDPEGPKVLFITNAGAEGLDLKGVRHVIIFESVWNINAEEQIIGRASRFRSHHHLPKSQRDVRVHKLVIIKPEANRGKDKFSSADVILRKLSMNKSKDTNELVRRLKEVSIENMEC